MSCSIEQQQNPLTRSRVVLRSRGSILMEFVLVLPIYIFLFGALYLVGDMGLNAIRISVGDRAVAMDAGDRTGRSANPFLNYQMLEEAAKTSCNESRTYRADTSFKGAWSWQAAGKTSFNYKLPSYGGGLISYPYLSYGGDTSDSSTLGSLVIGKSVKFRSKDYSLGETVRFYNYYTLKRTDLARDPCAYRNWDSWDDDGKQDTSINHLVKNNDWKSHVFGEPYANADPDKLDDASQGADKLPTMPGGRAEYTRDETLVEWSE